MSDLLSVENLKLSSSNRIDEVIQFHLKQNTTALLPLCQLT
jgi:hypothetical protein